MRLRALLAGLALLVLSAVVFTAGAGRGATPATTPIPPRSAAVPSFPPTPPAMPGRNVFEYMDDEAPRVATAAPRSRPAPAESQPVSDVAPEPPVHAVRLVGFVRRGGSLKAALALRDSVYVLSVGEQAEGYTLLAADEDAGVRIQGPEGVVLTLPPAS